MSPPRFFASSDRPTMSDQGCLYETVGLAEHNVRRFLDMISAFVVTEAQWVRFDALAYVAQTQSFRSRVTHWSCRRVGISQDAHGACGAERTTESGLLNVCRCGSRKWQRFLILWRSPYPKQLGLFPLHACISVLKSCAHGIIQDLEITRAYSKPKSSLSVRSYGTFRWPLT